jgi:hypothetical protein
MAEPGVTFSKLFTVIADMGPNGKYLGIYSCIPYSHLLDWVAFFSKNLP